MEKNITLADLAEMNRQFQQDSTAKVAMNAVAQVGLQQAALDYAQQRRMRYSFSTELKTGEVTNQKSSGRCWMFASLNIMRSEIMKRLNLETFELSQNYSLFYDKLEKSNFFLESILSTLDEPLDGRLVAHLLSGPLGDGGQWDMFRSLVDKYGVVPKDHMPETFHSSNTGTMTKFLTLKLRQFAYELRSAHSNGQSADELRSLKDAQLSQIYHMLCVCLGEPPKEVLLEVRDKDDVFHRDGPMSPTQFFAKYVGWNLDDYVSIINAPTQDKPYYKTYTVDYLGNVVGGRPIHYLNLPIDDLKAAAIRQLQAGEPVWFGCDVGQWLSRDCGAMDLQGFDFGAALGTDFPLSKAQRLDYGESVMTHAMVFQGVNIARDGRPDRWKVENSWGEKSGNKGWYIMSDAWFSEYTYQVVVNKKYLTEEQRTQLAQSPITLKPWDPMGSLATLL